MLSRHRSKKLVPKNELCDHGSIKVYQRQRIMEQLWQSCVVTQLLEFITLSLYMGYNSGFLEPQTTLASSIAVTTQYGPPDTTRNCIHKTRNEIDFTKAFQDPGKYFPFPSYSSSQHNRASRFSVQKSAHWQYRSCFRKL